MRAAASLLMMSLVLASCGKPQTSSGEATAGGDAALPADALPMKELMGHVIQFSADNVWKRQGYYTDASGEHSLFPKDEEGWLDAESAAMTLAELSNLLLEDGRKVDDPRWTKGAAEVRKAALQAAKAAETKNEDAFFTAGGAIYTACSDCHVAFAPGVARPGMKN